MATYTIEDIVIELIIQLPSNYPLGSITVESGKRIGVAVQQWRNWMLQLSTYLTHQVCLCGHSRSPSRPERWSVAKSSGAHSITSAYETNTFLNDLRLLHPCLKSQSSGECSVVRQGRALFPWHWLQKVENLGDSWEGLGWWVLLSQ